MIKKFRLRRTEGLLANLPLPKGGYVVRILKVDIRSNSRGQYLALYYDIAHGTYAGYWQKRYDSCEGSDRKWKGFIFVSIPTDDGTKEDGWSHSKFEAFLTALERSNPGYTFDWDEQHFVGLQVGAIFNLKDIVKDDGDTVRVTNFVRFASVETIVTNSFDQPKDYIKEQDVASEDFTDGGNKADTSGFVPDKSESTNPFEGGNPQVDNKGQDHVNPFLAQNSPGENDGFPEAPSDLDPVEELPFK